MAGHAGSVQRRPAILVSNVRVRTSLKNQVHGSVLFGRARVQRNGDVAGGRTTSEGDERLPIPILFGQHVRRALEDGCERIEIAVLRRGPGGGEVFGHQPNLRCCNTSTPGSGLPSTYSRKAPPPVER